MGGGLISQFYLSSVVFNEKYKIYIFIHDNLIKGDSQIVDQ